MLERLLEYNKELCACFVEWERAFDGFKLEKTLIKKETEEDWYYRRLARNLYVNQKVKIRVNDEKPEGC